MRKFEDIAMETTYIKVQRGGKSVRKDEQRLSDMWVDIKWSNLYVIRIPEWRS